MQRFYAKYETSLNFENSNIKSLLPCYMLNVFRPVFEVAREGRILKNIKHLQGLSIGVFLLLSD